MDTIVNMGVAYHHRGLWSSDWFSHNHLTVLSLQPQRRSLITYNKSSADAGMDDDTCKMVTMTLDPPRSSKDKSDGANRQLMGTFLRTSTKSNIVLRVFKIFEYKCFQ